MKKESEYAELQTMISELPEKIIVDKGLVFMRSYRLLIMKINNGQQGFVVRYALQHEPKQKQYFFADRYCFNFIGPTLYDAVKQAHDFIFDVLKRGYMNKDNHKWYFKLKRYIEDNPNPTGRMAVDWEFEDFYEYYFSH